MTTTPKPRRRWFQFGLRTVFVLMLTACIAMGWLGVKIQRARKERAAIEAIVQLGGRVQWTRPNSEVESPLRTWLVQMLGGEFSAHPCYVAVNNNAGMPFLAALRRLEGVELVGSHFTNFELAHVKNLTQLRSLWLHDTTVTDTGLEYVQGLHHLQTLLIDGKQFSDAGLAHLTSLSELEELYILDTRVTDSGLRELKQALPNCRIYCPPTPGQD